MGRIERLGHGGQGLVELVLGLALVAALVAGAGAMLRTEWNRVRCAYFAFEMAHARRAGRPPPLGSGRMHLRIEETARSVRGEAACGRIRESVELPRLDPYA